MYFISRYFFYFLLILNIFLLSFAQYDNVIYGYNYPYSTSNSIDGSNVNLFTGITGDFLSSMTSALLSGMGNGVTETFLPGTTSLNGIYPQQVDFNNIYPSNYYTNKLYPYVSEYTNNERNNIITSSGYENLFKGSVVSTPYTMSNLYTMPSSYYPSSAFDGRDGPKPLGSTYGGYSNAWGRPIIPIISSKETTAFNGKFLAALISKMGYQKSIQTTIPPSLANQINKHSSTVSPANEITKKNNLKRRKRNVVNKKLYTFHKL